MMNTDTNPLRAPWSCPDGVVIKDCDGKIVAVLARGGQDEGAVARCRVLAAAPDLLAHLRHVVEWHGHREGGNGLLGEDKLLPPDQQVPEIAGAMRLIHTITENKA